jgi:putative restriction endonuclease
MSDRSPLAVFDDLRTWSKQGERSPNKPLLVLFALARFASDGPQWIPYESAEGGIEALLRDFGPHRARYRPEFPFWHLEGEVWELSADDMEALRGLGYSPTRAALRSNHAEGRLTREVVREFERDPTAIARVAQRLLDAHFPQTLHADILSAVGLDLACLGSPLGGQSEAVHEGAPQARRPRDPTFRRKVLDAYQDRCAVCGLDLRLGPSTMGIEAAHIQWHQAGGPDVECNGLALCVLHHKVFDLGAFMVDGGLTLHVSDAVRGGDEGLGHALLRHHGQALREPVHPEHRPGEAFLNWHRAEVFKGRPRPAA